MLIKILPPIYSGKNILGAKPSRLFYRIIALACLFLAACSPEVILPTPSPTAWEGTLVTSGPSLTFTAPATSILTASATPSPSPTPSPTATPVLMTYKVSKNDDMFGIAWLFGVSPQMLMTANPSVNPRAMGVGTVLIIPVTPVPGGKTPAAGTPAAGTPSPAQATPAQPVVSAVGAPTCYPAGDGGLWCFWLLQSSTSQGVENVTGVISLSQPGAAPVDQAASLPLDILPAGASLPLAAYFPPPVPAAWTVSGKLGAYLPLSGGSSRYLPVTVQNLIESPVSGQASVLVKGELLLAGGSPTAKSIRVAATAFDGDGAVVGLRVWDAPGPLAAGSAMPFQVQVDSLGPAIDHVTVLVEARP